MPRTFYLLWLGAASVAAIGAAADTSWHFAHLFDEFSLPHLMLGAGLAGYVALLLWALVLERERLGAAERIAMQLAAVGIGVFLLFIPLDLIWHLIHGVDITTWSPTHLSLNYSSDLAHAGILAAWLASPSASPLASSPSRGRRAWLVTFAIGAATLLAVHYPLYQQEYAANVIDAFQHHRMPWYVAPDMLALAGPRAIQIVSSVPDWLYVVYTSLCVCYALTLGATVLGRGAPANPSRPDARARTVWPWPFGAASCIALAFVLFRIVSRQAFAALAMPVAVVPWYLVAMGLALDLTFALAPRLLPWVLARWPGLGRRAELIVPAVGGALAALVLSGCLLAEAGLHIIVPATPVAAVPFAVIAGAAGAAFAAWLASWMLERVPQVVAVPESESTLRERLLAYVGSRRGSQPSGEGE